MIVKVDSKRKEGREEKNRKEQFRRYEKIDDEERGRKCEVTKCKMETEDEKERKGKRGKKGAAQKKAK